MSLRHSPKIVTNGLVFALDAANNKSYPGSGTSWYDLSGNSNNGTLTNGPTFSNVNQGSIVFDGVNDYVQTNLSGMGQVSLVCFFNPTISNSGLYYEGLIDNDTPGQYGQGMGINNGVFETILDNQFWTPNVSVDVGRWQMCVLSINSTTAKFYKNGILRSTLSYTQGAVTTSNYIIGKSNANARYINGKIAICLIYNRVLSDTEVLQNYNATKSRFGL